MAKSNSTDLEVQSREETGSNAARRLRASGLVPGNVYGLDRPPFKVAVDPSRIDDLLRLGSGANTIFTLRLAGEQKKRETMIKELQRDPVSEKPIHVDFVRIDAGKAVHVDIPIQLIGIATGVKNDGGVMDFVHRSVQVECLPGNIPEHFDVDVTELHINQHISFKDLKVGDNVLVLDDPEQIIAVVVPPRVEEAPAEADAEAAEETDAAADEGAEQAKEGEEEKPSDSKG
jgi:large subunit ribosomal protein L25